MYSIYITKLTIFIAEKKFLYNTFLLEKSVIAIQYANQLQSEAIIPKRSSIGYPRYRAEIIRQSRLAQE